MGSRSLVDFIRTATSVIAYENGCFGPDVFVHQELSEFEFGSTAPSLPFRPPPQSTPSPLLFPLLRPGDDPTKNPGPYSFLSWLENGIFPSISACILKSFTLALWSRPATDPYCVIQAQPTTSLVTYQFVIDYVDKDKSNHSEFFSPFLPVLELLRYEETKRRLSGRDELASTERYLSMEMETVQHSEGGFQGLGGSQFSAPEPLSCFSALQVKNEAVIGCAFNSDHMVTLRIQERSTNDPQAMDFFEKILPTNARKRKLIDSPLGTETSTLVVQTPSTMDSFMYF